MKLRTDPDLWVGIDSWRVLQVEEAEKLEAATYASLEATPRDGVSFAAAARALLSDEAHWVAWKKTPGGTKNILCTSYVMPPYTIAADLESRVTLPGGGCRLVPADCVVRGLLRVPQMT